MKNLLRQELYKLSHQRSVQIFYVFLLIFQIVIASYTVHYPEFLTPHDSFVNSFYAFIPITLFLVAVGSTYLTTERQTGTLRALLYRQYSRLQVLVSKWLAVLILMITTYLLSDSVGLVMKLVVFRTLTLTSKLWRTWWLTNLDQFLSLFLLITIVLLVGSLFTSSTPAIITGILIYFTVSVFSQLLFYLIARVPWLRWNPLNSFNLGGQLSSPHLQVFTMMTVPQLVGSYVVYAVLFLSLAGYSFDRRNV